MTKGKNILDKALKLSKKLKKEMATVTEFLTMVNTDLDKRESTTAAKNVDTDLAYIQVRM